MMRPRSSSHLARGQTAGRRALGFTVAEVLVAITVLTVALGGLIAVYTTGHTFVSQSGRDTSAAAVAQTLIEAMRNQPTANLQSLHGLDSDNPGACPGAVGSRVNNLCNNWIAQVTQLPEGRGTVSVIDTQNAGTGIILHTATVIVSWTEAGSGRRQLTVISGRSD